MTTEERNAKMKAAGIQAGSPAAKRFIADNETDEEAIERRAEELKASGQRVVPPGGPPSKPSNEQKTTNPTLLNESIKQTGHLKGIQDILTFFLILTLISAFISIFYWIITEL